MDRTRRLVQSTACASGGLRGPTFCLGATRTRILAQVGDPGPVPRRVTNWVLSGPNSTIYPGAWLLWGRIRAACLSSAERLACSAGGPLQLTGYVSVHHAARCAISGACHPQPHALTSGSSSLPARRRLWCCVLVQWMAGPSLWMFEWSLMGRSGLTRKRAALPRFGERLCL